MSWLLFMDESGHDHKNLPYEVRGGIALHASELWTFVRDLQRVELDAFGTRLQQYRKEFKGCKLLDKDRYKWAAQSLVMEDKARRKHCRAFLTKGLQKQKPTREEFTAYGQASLDMARGVFQTLREHKAVLFASAVPRSVKRPDTYETAEYLRKDHAFLLERFHYFLEQRREDGLLVMDETDKMEDQRFVRRVEAYFTKTQTGRYRSQWIVPTPFFVSSDMSYPVQAADVCIYCVNWGFRLPTLGMDAPTRPEIATEFGPWLSGLQFEGDGYRAGAVHHCYGVVYVPDPYTAR